VQVSPRPDGEPSRWERHVKTETGGDERIKAALRLGAAEAAVAFPAPGANLKQAQIELDAIRAETGGEEREAVAIVRELVGNTYGIPFGTAERIDEWGKKYDARKGTP
jgi:hypothetical protein